MFKKVALITLVSLLLGLWAIAHWSYTDAVWRFETEDKVVALTFDDGPNPPYTRELITLLLEHNVRATFFVKGRNVEAFPMDVRALALAGHEVANHSYSHRRMLSFDVEAMREEVERTNELIKRELNLSTSIFRPPYGLQGPGLKLALEELDMTSVVMSEHGSDWDLTDPELIADKVLRDIGPGAIILLHDGHGDVDDPETQDSRAATVAATEIIVETLKSRGYAFATVSQMIDRYGK